MNSRLLIPCLLALVGCSGGAAPEPSPSAAPPSTIAAAPSPAGPSLLAEVVTLDAAAPSITLREGDVPAGQKARASDIKNGDRTIRVEPSAAASLAGLKPGDRVRVNCSPIQATMMAAPAGTASPASAAPGTAAAGATRGLAECDSVVAITAAGAGAP
jgi:hypothetical protein